MAKGFAFVSSSFEYTCGVLPLARRLEQHGYEVHWISFRGYERRWLIENGVSPARILDTLNAFDPKRLSGEELARRLTRLEDGAPPYANDIILMDRLLKRKSDGFGYAYLAHLDEVVDDYLRRHNIQFVSAGRDTALQLVCAKICARLGIVSVVPTAMRIPDDRYGFCRGHTENEFVRFRETDEAARAQARQFLRMFRETKPVPHNVVMERKNNAFLRRVPHDVRLYASFFFRGLHDLNNDYTRYSLRQLLRMYLRRRVNALHLSLAPPFEAVGERPFVIYAYHMQPESSVDVLASFLSDQPALIRQIARALPASHELYVKPHQDHVGGLSRRELLVLKKIPGVRLVSPFLPSHDLMLRSSAIITLTGTMAFQGALHGIPSIIFAPQFFRALPGVHYCTSPLDLPALFARVLSRPKGDQDPQIVEFIAQHLADSFVGRVSPYGTPFTEAEVIGLVNAYETAYRIMVGPSWQPVSASA
jgi:hypothetical protein